MGYHNETCGCPECTGIRYNETGYHNNSCGCPKCNPSKFPRHSAVRYSSLKATPQQRFCGVLSVNDYILPNAACPVCGQQAFFYFSPYGGSIWFKHLGPPWPKHSCDEFSAQSSGMLSPLPQVDSAGSNEAEKSLNKWKPLVGYGLKSVKGHDCITLARGDRKVSFWLSSGSVVCRPMFWRILEELRCVELATIVVWNNGTLMRKRVKVPIAVENDALEPLEPIEELEFFDDEAEPC